MECAVHTQGTHLHFRQHDSLQQAVGERSWRMVQPTMPQKEQGWDQGLWTRTAEVFPRMKRMTRLGTTTCALWDDIP